MIDRDRLPLHEEVLLLAMRDEEGTIAAGTMYQYAIAGAVLSELVLQGRVAVDDSGRKKLAKVIDPRPTGAPLLDECLDKIAAGKPKPLDHWVGRFANIKNLKHRVAARLCGRVILRE